MRATQRPRAAQRRRSAQRRKAWTSSGAVAAVLALVVAPTIGTAPTAPAAAASTTVLALDFEDGTNGSWTQSGGPTLSHPSDTALRVADRTETWDGLTSPAVSVEAGVTYTFTARARLAAGTSGTVAMRFQTGAPSYTWIGDTPGVGSTGWTTITDTWVAPADGTESFTFGAGALAGAASYTYLVDDLRITRPAADPTAPPVVVAAADFETEGRGGWTQSGNPTLTEVVTGRHLRVDGRAHDYDGIKSPETDFEGGVTYTFSARARLTGPTPASTQLRFVVEPAYQWIGTTTVTSDWTTVTGTWTPTEDTRQAVFIGTGQEADAPFGYEIDDIRVERAGDPPSGSTTVLTSDFEAVDLSPWAARGGTIARTTDAAHGGDAAMLVAGRTQNWHGAETPLASLLAAGGTYTVEAWVRLAPGTAPTTVKMTAAEVPTEYVEVIPATAVTADEWVHLTGTYTRGTGVTGGVLYFEAASETASFLVDDVTVVGPPAGSDDGWVPDLDGFVPGGAVDPTTTPVGAARSAGEAPTAALTFDDGPNGGDTARLLAFLRAQDVTATFCVIGQNLATAEAKLLLQQVVADGHTLCNHGMTYGSLGGKTRAEVETDLKAALAAIREALGDPDAAVPYFRAANGDWGRSAEVAVALGMQPLAVRNTIEDWVVDDVETLTANLRTSMRDGEIVLVHDGGGVRTPSVEAVETVVAERLAAGWVFTLPVGGTQAPPTRTSIDADFEDGTLQGWSGRDAGNGPPTVEVVSPGRDSDHAARISDRTSQGQGLQTSVVGIFEPGATYDFSAWIRFEGTPGDVTLSAHVSAGGASSYPNLVQLPGMSNDWVEVSGSFTMPSYTDAAEVYVETAWANGAAGNTSTFLLDDLVFTQRPDPVIEDLPALHGAIDVPLGVAADSRETFRSARTLLTKHFEQVTPENSMKPEAWYSGRTFTPSAESDALMDFAAEEGLGVYGHVLVWHAQTPAWFFQDPDGDPLPVTEASAAVVRQRMYDHMHAIAEHMVDRYGEFGSPTNPLVAWDVVNEVVSDGAEHPDGLRRSEWFRYLGEEFVDLAFAYADEIFNEEFAAPGTDRPVALFINDYNSELPGKQTRYLDLVERLLDRGVPVDGVGHQFHVSLSLPAASLGDTLTAFSGLGVRQAVTELDVTTGTPVTEALLVEQGYYYRDAFRAFREHEDQLFSVTVWGLYDTRSWRSSSGAPLVFDDGMQAKPAYHGIMDDELPPRVRTADVFAGDVPLGPGATTDATWGRLRLHDVDGAARWQARWAPDHLTVLARVTDAYDTLEVQLDGATWVLERDGTGDLPGVVRETADGWDAVVHVPLTGATEGLALDVDVRVASGADVVGWSTPGTLGTLVLLEELSATEVVAASTAPAVDGEVDDVWQTAGWVRTERQVSGTGGATAKVRTLWQGMHLYVLADVTDPVVDTSSASPWERDSVELFLDSGNFRNGSYRYDDMQVRIDADGTVSIGAGDEAYHLARVESAVARTATGYRVEAALELKFYGGEGSTHGFDVQVNDASAGARTSVRTWADPTGQGYQTPRRWGVAELLAVGAGPSPSPSPSASPTPSASPAPGGEQGPSIALSVPRVRAGQEIRIELSGFDPGDVVGLALDGGVTAGGGLGGVGRASAGGSRTTLGTATVGADGSGVLTARVPASLAPGTYRLLALVDGDVLAEDVLTVLAAQAAGVGRGALARTGAGLGIGLLAVLTVLTGSVLVAVRHRGPARVPAHRR